jgi:hypothetical protein
MKRILFFLLWVILVFQIPAYSAIEIYVNGHKYDSPQAYLASKRSAVVVGARHAVPVHKDLSDAVLHKLYVLSVENGMVSALQDFYQALGQSNSISPEQLQEAIQQTVTTSKDPKLLISGAGKVRIMSLTTGV